MSNMKKLKVDLDNIGFVMGRSGYSESVTLFDTETGEVVTVPDELMDAVDSGDEEAVESLPEWEKDLMGIAKSISADESGRFLEIPEKSSYEAYDLMVEFTGTIQDRRLREKLESSLDGKGAFRRFKNALSDDPEEEKRWFALKDKKMKEEVVEWLNSIGIEPME